MGGGSFYLVRIKDGKGGAVISFWFILGTSGPSLQGTGFQVLNSSSFSECGRWTEEGREGWDGTRSPWEGPLAEGPSEELLKYIYI